MLRLKVDVDIIASPYKDEKEKQVFMTNAEKIIRLALSEMTLDDWIVNVNDIIIMED